jgi:hypothetical protein
MRELPTGSLDCPGRLAVQASQTALRRRAIRRDQRNFEFAHETRDVPNGFTSTNSRQRRAPRTSLKHERIEQPPKSCFSGLGVTGVTTGNPNRAGIL